MIELFYAPDTDFSIDICVVIVTTFFSPRMQLAVALYNNYVDDEDELEFRKGDILTVLIENPHGFDGWWLCKLNDKCGLCPGNRLRLIENKVTSPIKINEFASLNARLSTASMYDDLSKAYDNATIKSPPSHYEYGNFRNSNHLINSKNVNSSPESSVCSSGIYSSNDLHLSSSSSSDYNTILTHHTVLSLTDLDQMRCSLQTLCIRSKILDRYYQLISRTTTESIVHAFIIECYSFLHNYGCLLDRYTYRLIKENYLYELERTQTKTIELATKIIQLIKSFVDLRSKQRYEANACVSNDVLRKLHLEPTAESPNEKTNPLSSSSKTTTNIYNDCLHSKRQTSMRLSKTCHSNFLSSSTNQNSADNDPIDENYSKNPLIRCYYRHVNEQINAIIERFSYLLESELQIALLITEGKALIVAGHKLIFVLETLHEHVRQIHTSLIHLKTQLCEALKSFIQLLKEFSQTNCTNIQNLIIPFMHDVRMILDIAQKIRRHCNLL